ncbi:hypothetical protein MMC13_001399 [Lambiella insularis]|nr:hypothetical protein [Lambiella insularis]
MHGMPFPSTWRETHDNDNEFSPSSADSLDLGSSATVRSLHVNYYTSNHQHEIKRSSGRPRKPLRAVERRDSFQSNSNLPTQLDRHVRVSQSITAHDSSIAAAWQRNVLPRELLNVAAGTPDEIRVIVIESVNQANAIRASLFESGSGQQQVVDASRTFDYRPQRSPGPESPPQHLNQISHERLSSSHSESTTSSEDSWPLAAGRYSVDSVTSAGSSPRLEVTTPAVGQLDEAAHLSRGSLSPLKHLFGHEPEKNARKHGIMKLLRGKEHKLKDPKRKSTSLVLDTQTKECASCFDDIPSNAAIGLSRRQAELAARRAIIDQEEAEVQAAIKAVAEAERRERQEVEEEERRIRLIAEEEQRQRVAREEARQAVELQILQRLESDRIATINNHYATLRTCLSELHRMQRKAIRGRHSTEMYLTQNELENIAAEEVELHDEQVTFKRAWEESYKAVQSRFAREIIDTTIRHRADQGDLLQKLDESSIGEAVNNDITRAAKIEELIMLQQTEREVLRQKHRRGLRKLQARDADQRLEDRRSQQVALQQKKEIALKAIDDFQGRTVSDSEWLEFLILDREARLNENRQRHIASGADAPSSNLRGTLSTENVSRAPSMLIFAEELRALCDS